MSEYLTPHLTPESGSHLLVPIPGRWSRIVQFVNNPSLPVTDSELTMSAPSKMDKGAPEVRDELLMLGELILIHIENLPWYVSPDATPSYKVGPR